jgi:hypothetical protein
LTVFLPKPVPLISLNSDHPINCSVADAFEILSPVPSGQQFIPKPILDVLRCHYLSRASFIMGIAVGTGWARVEANKHNPSDVLVGYALGHFLSAFINDAFLGLDHEKAPLLNIEQSDKGISISLNWSF